MNLHLKPLFFQLLMLTMLMPSCKKDSNLNNNSDSTFHCLINGVPFTGFTTHDSNVFSKHYLPGHEEKRLDIKATDSIGNTLIVQLGDVRAGYGGYCIRPDTFNANRTSNWCGLFGNIHACNWTQGTYRTAGNKSYYSSVLTLDKVIISSCNESKQRISGTFSYTLVHFSSSDTLKITDGVFSNQFYRIE